MKIKAILAAATVAVLAAPTPASAQGRDWGSLRGSFETNTIGYINDPGLGAAMPEDNFGSNNYLKLDYTKGKLSAGLQVESYLPALYGYGIGQQADPKKFWLGSKYISWTDDNFFVLAGNIYDQLGNGLIFRSYEDRQLGLNNSLEGIAAGYNFSRFVSVRAMYGRPRLYTDYAQSWVRAANLTVSVADIFNWENIYFTLEGNAVNRHEALDLDPIIDFSASGIDSPDLYMFSGAANFGWKGLSLKGEYAVKGKDLSEVSLSGAQRGAAVYGEAIYNNKGLSVSATFRMLDNMGTKLSLYGTGTGNTLNYLPALTRQYTYLLANLNPYQIVTAGEIAGQADVFYKLQSRSDRRKYWNFHANFATAYTMKPSQTMDGSRHLLWSDINVDVERSWGRSLRTTLLYSRQEWSESHGVEAETYVSNIFVGEATWRIDRKNSLHAELQYLQSNDYEGDWAAVVLEYNFAPKWSIYASDMYNLEGTKKNYYNFGFSYSHGSTRIQLGFGRNRAGDVCSGGVCRYTPAYTGLNLAITSSF